MLGSTPDEARTALLAVEDSGRAAIVELQHLLGLLAPPDAARDEPPPPPQPGLDQVGPLIDRVATAGLPVELRVRGLVRPLPPGLNLAAYRVVQEALTNVLKHAGQPATTVTLDYQPGALIVEVADDGLPRWAGQPARHRARPARPAGTGRAVRRRAGCGRAAGRRLAGPGPDPRRAGRAAGMTGDAASDGTGPDAAPPRVLIADDQTWAHRIPMILGRRDTGGRRGRTARRRWPRGRAHPDGSDLGRTPLGRRGS